MFPSELRWCVPVPVSRQRIWHRESNMFITIRTIRFRDNLVSNGGANLIILINVLLFIERKYQFSPVGVRFVSFRWLVSHVKLGKSRSLVSVHTADLFYVYALVVSLTTFKVSVRCQPFLFCFNLAWKMLVVIIVFPYMVVSTVNIIVLLGGTSKLVLIKRNRICFPPVSCWMYAAVFKLLLANTWSFLHMSFHV